MPYVPRLAFALALLLAAGALIYAPGLSGGFLFDDHANLQVLHFVSRAASAEEVLSFALAPLSGMSRLIPSLTFILQAEDWPDFPGRFIAVNILLHLLNSALVFLLGRSLSRQAGLSRQDGIGLLACAIWMLSPLQVASLLYVVQRINEIAAFFVLLGALTYLRGRERLAESPRLGALYMIAGVFVCGGLAVFSKENGVLLPLLLLVAEATLLPALAQGSAVWIRRIVLGLPLLALLVALAAYHEAIMAGYQRREFVWHERLLTQPGILLDYLGRFLAPRSAGLGLYHDDWPVTRWPIEPLQALAIVALLISAAIAMRYRRRWPVPAFALLWYLAGHALEASWIPLELYFEHRNYLPLFGPAFGVAALCVASFARPARRRYAAVLCTGWLAFAITATAQQTVLWGQPGRLVRVGYAEHPQSLRAANDYAQLLARTGDLRAAARIYSERVNAEPGRPELYGAWLHLACLGPMPMPEFVAVHSAFQIMGYSQWPLNNLSAIADAMESGECAARLHPLPMLNLLRTLAANPNFAPSRPQIQLLSGRYLELAGRYLEAYEVYNIAYQLSGNPEIAFLEVRVLLSLRRVEDADRRLDEIEAIVRAGGTRLARYRGDIVEWRERVAVFAGTNR